MGTLFVDKLDPQSGTSLEIGSSGDTITIPSGCTITNNGTQTGFGGTNTKMFLARMTSTQSLSDAVTAKLTMAEVLDPDSTYDGTTNYRFTVPSGQAGKYYFYAQLDHQGTAMTANWTLFKKNGNYIRGSHFDADNVTYNSQRLTGILDLAESDYIEVWGYNDTTSGTNSVAKSFTIDSNETFTTFFGGYKIIE